MKVLIVGSMTPFKDDDEKREEFKNACIEIGGALARNKLEILVASSSLLSADLYVVKGASKIDGRHRISVLRPLIGSEPEFDKEYIDVQNLDISVKRLNGNWSSSRVPQVLAADVVLLIGGENGVRTVGHVAQALEKPVLAIRSFGGASEEIWRIVNTKYEQSLSQNDAYHVLNESWKDGNGEKVVQVLRDLYSIQPFRIKKRMPFAIYNLSLILFLSTWVWIFTNIGQFTDSKNEGSVNVIQSHWFFFITFIAGILGVMLRTNLKLMFDKAARFTWNELFIEIGTGLLLGFAMTLLYLTGSVTFSPNQNSGVVPQTIDAFQRISLIMTLLGLGCGLKIELAAERLRSWFSDRMGDSASR